ncbi:MAG: tetratricopeptide repeat protein [Zoogloeaceae bacterium]|jgi:TPR repeat protein|nr:tetratricopeptide repeat protein [Zoogloeaceae bacterium]
MNVYHRLLASCVIALAIFAPVSTFAAPETAKAEKPRMRYVVMLGSHDFAGLAAAEKAIMEDYRKGRIDTDEFTTQLVGLVSPFSTSYIPDAELWVKAQPKSYAARFGLGRLYLYAAWEARGEKFIHETSQEQIDKMEELAQKSLENLQASLALFEKPYPSYTNLIEADILLSYGKKRDYLDSAIKIDPAANIAYRRYFGYSTPRWGGSYKEMESLLAKAKQGPMPPQKLAELEALVLGLKGDDERDLGRKATLYLQAYEQFPRQQYVTRLYLAAWAFKKAGQAERAIEVYSRIIKAYPDEANAYAERGYQYDQMPNYELALKDFVTSAKLGNRWAQNNAGYYYMVGRGGVKDLKLAKHYLSQSAAQGFEHAREKLKVLEAMMEEEAKP